MITRRYYHTAPATPSLTAEVAVLYTTRNDFQRSAALSCLALEYTNKHVFLCDDSDDLVFQQQIDAFHEEYSQETTVIRRGTRQGFKAGNLNHALKSISDTFSHFLVMDSDGHASPTMIQDLLSCFDPNGSVGFVQANCRYNPHQDSCFASNVAGQFGTHWSYYLLPRNRHGFVMFVGHGALIRRDVWREVGGFPEIVAEDLGFSTRLRRQGYVGIFAPNALCDEDFPDDFNAFRRRHRKCVSGTLEFLQKEGREFFTASSVPWFEKLDVLVGCVGALIGLPFLAFLVLSCAIMPIFFGDYHEFHLVLLDRQFTLWPVFLMDRTFENLMSWEFYIVSAIAAFSPVYWMVLDGYRKPFQLVRTIASSMGVYISATLITCAETYRFLRTNKAIFYVTGDQSDPGAAPTKSSVLAHFQTYLLVGSVGIVLALLSFNPAAVAFSVTFFVGAAVDRYGFENRAVRWFSAAPLVLLLCAFLASGAAVAASSGALLPIFMVHF